MTGKKLTFGQERMERGYQGGRSWEAMDPHGCNRGVLMVIGSIGTKPSAQKVFREAVN